jgi:hypothetical protein
MTGIRAGVHNQPSGGGEADRLPGTTACYPAGHAALSGAAEGRGLRSGVSTGPQQRAQRLIGPHNMQES